MHGRHTSEPSTLWDSMEMHTPRSTNRKNFIFFLDQLANESENSLRPEWPYITVFIPVEKEINDKAEGFADVFVYAKE